LLARRFRRQTVVRRRQRRVSLLLVALARFVLVGAVRDRTAAARLLSRRLARQQLGIDDARRLVLGQRRLDLGRRAQAAPATAPALRVAVRLLRLTRAAARLGPLERRLVAGRPDLEILEVKR